MRGTIKRVRHVYPAILERANEKHDDEEDDNKKCIKLKFAGNLQYQKTMIETNSFSKTLF